MHCPKFAPKKTNSGTYIQCHTCRKYFNAEKMNFSNQHWFCNSCYGVGHLTSKAKGRHDIIETILENE